MSIEEAVSSCNFRKALTKTEATLARQKLREPEALNILLALSRKLRESSAGNIHCDDIYKLAAICCSVIEKKWNVDVPKFYQILYFIIKSLVKEERGLLGRNLTVYLFKSKSVSKSIKEEQKVVLSSLFILFFNFLSGIKSKKDLVANGEESSLSWWQFILELVEANGYSNLSTVGKVFNTLIDSTVEFQKSNTFDVGNQMLISLGEWLVKKGSLSSSEESTLCIIIQKFFTILIQLETSDFTVLTDFMKLVIDNVNLSLDLLNPILLLIGCFSQYESGSLKSLPKILSTLKALKCSELEFYSLSSTVIFELSLKLKSFKIIEVKTYLSYCFFLYLKLHEICNNRMSKSFVKLLSYPLFALMKVIPAYDDKVLKEQEIFVLVYKCILNFFTISFEESPSSFNYGINLCAEVIQAYIKNCLLGEACKLAKTAVKSMIEMKWSNESLKPDILLTTFIDVSCKYKNFEHEALAYILGIAESNSPMKINAFKYWCLLKQKSSQNSILTVTVHDIICANDSMDETMTPSSDEWPFNVIKTMDYEKALLDEIRSYTKARNFKKQYPTIAVYKKAIKVVKDKQILAKIICCTMDALTSELDNQTNLSNLETALKSLIKIIKKNGGQDSLLGNLYYMSSRCELSTIRKAIQVEDSNKEDTLPLPEDLSVTVINSNKFVPSVSQFIKLLDYLKLASEYWRKGLLENDNINVDCDTVNYIKGVAYLYRLLKYTALEIKTWYLLYDVAKKLKFEKYTILAVAELLESKMNVEDSKIAEVKDLISTPQHKDNYYNQLFVTQLARYKLKNSKYEEAENILAEMDREKLKYSVINFGRWYLIDFLVKNSQVSKLPPENLLESLFQSYSYIHCAFQNSAGTFCETCVAQCLTFELCNILAKTLGCRSDVKRAITYCREFGKSPSLLCFPLRRSEFHSELAQLSIISCNETELHQKIIDIESILEVNLNENSSSNQGKLWKEQLLADRPEQLLLLISLYSLWGRYHQLNNKSQESIKVFIDGINFVNSLKKSMPPELMNSFIENEIRLYLNAATSLICWEKYAKAQTYCEYVMSRYKNLQIKDQLLLQRSRTILLCSILPQSKLDIETSEIPTVHDDVGDVNTTCSTPMNVKETKARLKSAPHKKKTFGSKVNATPNPIHKSLVLPDKEDKKNGIPAIFVTDDDGSVQEIGQKLSTCRIPPVSTPKKIQISCDSPDSSAPPSLSLRKKKLAFLTPKVNVQVIESDDSDISVIESSPKIRARKVYTRQRKK